MQEHALPQDVTGYKFHIIGNMTLKQFGEVAAGCIVGFLLYQTNLYPFIKIPLVVLAGAAGAMVAFVPIEERPLDQWITAFFRALYRPTQYYWKRMVKIPEPFLYEPRATLRTVVADVDLTPARRQRVKDYLRSIDKETETADQLDQYTEQRMNEVIGQFGTVQPSFLLSDSVSPTTGQPLTNEEAMLTASPDSVAETVDNLSFVGRVGSEEPVADIGPTEQEMEMSNNVLRLFDADQTAVPQPDTIPQPELAPPLPEPEPPLPPAPLPEPETIPPEVTISTPSPEPPKPVSPEPAPEPEPIPVIEPKPEPEPLPPPPPKMAPSAPNPAAVPQDMKELPDVSLEPEKQSAPEPAEIPQISTVFETPQAGAESIPKVDTDRYSKYSLSSHPTKVNTDSSQVAQIADVLSQSNPMRRRGKTSVQFKTKRTASSDKFETVLPHILDMTGSSETVKTEQPVAPEPVKPLQNVSKEVVVPELEDIRVEHTIKESEDSNKKKSDEQLSTAVDPSLLQLPESKKAVEASGAVTFNANLPFPDKPTKPNRVVGMVIDQTNNSLPGAIVEILSPEGVTARAVRTNPLGQFFIATPLIPGEYLITADKEGYNFSTQKLSVTDKIIDPIEIRAN